MPCAEVDARNQSPISVASGSKLDYWLVWCERQSSGDWVIGPDDPIVRSPDQLCRVLISFVTTESRSRGEKQLLGKISPFGCYGFEGFLRDSVVRKAN